MSPNRILQFPFNSCLRHSEFQQPRRKDLFYVEQLQRQEPRGGLCVLSCPATYRAAEIRSFPPSGGSNDPPRAKRIPETTSRGPETYRSPKLDCRFPWSLWQSSERLRGANRRSRAPTPTSRELAARGGQH